MCTVHILPHFWLNATTIASLRWTSVEGWGYGTLSIDLLTGCHHYSIMILNVRVVCRGQVSQSSPTKDIKMGWCIFQCDIPHQWVAHRHTVTRWIVMSVWQHPGQSATAITRQSCNMTSGVKVTLNPNKPPNQLAPLSTPARSVYVIMFAHIDHRTLCFY